MKCSGKFASIMPLGVALVGIAVVVSRQTAGQEQAGGRKLIGSRAGEVRSDNDLKTPLVWIPPGEFTMGSPEGEKDRSNSEDQVQVTLTKGFWLGQHEVTQAEWRRVMQTKPWSGKGDVREGDDYPACYVNWDDATKFCAKVTEQERRAGRLPDGWQYALPTEAQWEYACRGGTKSRFSFGDDEKDLGTFAWWGGIFGEGNAQYERYAHRVGQKKNNPFGLYDMHGNVYEWCRDWYARELAGGSDPQGPSAGANRVIRGGAWAGEASSCRSAYRYMYPPSVGFNALGLRVALIPKTAVAVGGSQPNATRKRSAVASAPPPEPARIHRPPLPRHGKEPELLVAPFGGDKALAARKAWAKFHAIGEAQTNSIGMKFTLIPPGEFQMGSTPADVEKVMRFDPKFQKAFADEERPQHRVRITQPFYLGTYEVTKGQFHDFADDTGYQTSAEKDRQGCGGYTGRKDEPFDNRPSYTWREWGVDEGEDSPVVQVSRDDAMAFCEWLSKKEGREYRLPTEAEWEYACRAGTTSLFASGDDPEGLTKIGNVADATAKENFPKWFWTVSSSDGWALTAPVGQFRPNNFGLYDMTGNVWEWCADAHEGNYYAHSPLSDPPGPVSKYTAVARGGSWLDGPSSCRSASRYGAGRISRLNTHGFRIAAVPNVPVPSTGDRSASQAQKGVLADDNGLGGTKRVAPAAAELLVSPFDERAARAARKAWARQLKIDVEQRNSLGMKLLLISPGRFAMGSPETAEELMKAFPEAKRAWFSGERPVHAVTISRPFYLGKFEVTKGQFQKFVDDTGYRTDADKDGKGGFGYTGENTKPFEQRSSFLWDDWGVEQSENSPVVNVSHNDAVAFCDWLSRKEGKKYRLPTEAEWEYACRAGTATRYYNGDDPEKLTQIANIWDGSAKATIMPSAIDTVRSSDGWPLTSPAGRFPPNNFGLYDMLGNVWEWCSDWDGPDYYAKSPERDPPGPISGKLRVFRGGSWRAGAVDCRAASRGLFAPGYRFHGLGFRVARSLRD